MRKSRYTDSLYDLEPKLEKRVTVGSLPFRNKREKRKIKYNLILAFNNNVKFTEQNGFIMYEYQEKVQAI
ncbi:hypothetical protein JNUCC23_09030 [Peribacillus sp. JNUCC 23]